MLMVRNITTVRRGGVTLMGFDSFSQIVLVVENLFNRATHTPRPSCEHLAEFAWWKIFYFIFQKPIKLTSAVGVTLMGHSINIKNSNLTTEMGSD